MSCEHLLSLSLKLLAWVPWIGCDFSRSEASHPLYYLSVTTPSSVYGDFISWKQWCERNDKFLPSSRPQTREKRILILLVVWGRTPCGETVTAVWLRAMMDTHYWLCFLCSCPFQEIHLLQTSTVSNTFHSARTVIPHVHVPKQESFRFTSITTRWEVKGGVYRRVRNRLDLSKSVWDEE